MVKITKICFHLLCCTTLIILSFCKSDTKELKKQIKNDKFIKPSEGYEETLDNELFQNLHLEKFKTLEERLKVLKESKVEVHFYSENWTPCAPKYASFINTIKLLKNNDYLIKDYYISGEIQFSGKCKTTNAKTNWKTIYTSGKNQISKYGKQIYWNKIGLIEQMKFYIITDLEKGYGSSQSIDFEKYQPKSSTQFSIKNGSNFNVDILFEQNKASIIYQLNDYDGHVKAIYNPDLSFIFSKNSMKIGKKNVIKSILPKSFKGSFNSIKCENNFEYYVPNLGQITLKNTGQACDDTQYNSFNLEGNGTVLIEGLLNTEIFVTDSDGDGVNEIYIISFRKCINEMKVIRIQN